jgi:hypothetical protein
VEEYILLVAKEDKGAGGVFPSVHSIRGLNARPLTLGLMKAC